MTKLVCIGVMLAAALLVGCAVQESANDSGSPSQRFHLNSAQIAEQKKKAEAGDAKAAARLANHYQWAVSDQANATIWLRKGVELNDPWSMINLSAIVAVNADETSCREAEALLLRAISDTAHADAASTAKADLQTLHNGVDGSGYCSAVLRPKDR